MSKAVTTQKSISQTPDSWFHDRFPGAFSQIPDAAVFARSGKKRRIDGFVSSYAVADCLSPDGSPDSPIRFCPDDNSLYEYNPTEGIYQVRTPQQVMHNLRMILEECAAQLPENDRTAVRSVATPRYLRPIITALEGVHNLPHPDLNRDLRYLHCKNGIVDLESLDLMPFHPWHPSTWKLPIPWDSAAAYPHRFAGMLRILFPRREDRELAIDVLASAFLGNPFQRLLVLSGTGGTGKTSLLTILEALLGPGAFGHLRLNHSQNRFTASGWAGKLVLHEAETDQECLGRGLEALKSLSGQDTIEVELKYVQARTSFRPRALPVVTTNHELHIQPSGDYGAWRRRLVVFEVPEPAQPFDPQPRFAEELLQAEGPGILRLFLTRAHRLTRQTSLRPLSAAQKARLNAFLSSGDPLAEWAETHVQPMRGGGVLRDEAIASATRWLNRRNHSDVPSSTTAWSRRLKPLMEQRGGKWSNSMTPQPKGWRGVHLP